MIQEMALMSDGTIYYGRIKNEKSDGYGVIMYAPYSSICYVGQFEKENIPK